MKKLNFKRFKNRKNPYIYDHGYHATEEQDLNNILVNGFKLRPTTNKYNTALNYLYDNYNPIYFLTSPHYFKYYKHTPLRHNLRFRKFLIKVNVKKFDQLVDFQSFSDINLGYNMEYVYPSINIKYFLETPLLYKWLIKFDNQIPIKEFKTNQKLIVDMIITTQTFTVLENIHSEYIEDIIRIK